MSKKFETDCESEVQEKCYGEFIVLQRYIRFYEYC